MRRILLLTLLLGASCEQPGPKTEAPAATKPAMPVVPGADAEPVELELENQREPFHGIVTAGQPTAEQYSKLRAAGYTAVINLRKADEPGYVDGLDAASRQLVGYKHIPIGGADDLTRENVDLYAKAIAEPHAKDGKVLVHCGSGNRAGALIALNAAWNDGRSTEDALELGRKAGLTKLEPAVRKLLEADQ